MELFAGKCGRGKDIGLLNVTGILRELAKMGEVVCNV